MQAGLCVIAAIVYSTVMAKPKYKSDRRSSDKRSRSKTAPRGKPAYADKRPTSDDASTVKAKAPAAVIPDRQIFKGARLAETTGMVLENPTSRDYALLDSGSGLKLERYGELKVVRPEGQAIWLPQLDKSEWQNADAIFTGDREEEGTGRWQFPKKELGETWPLEFDGLPFWGRFTSFRHVGVFPEQAAHWFALQKAIKHAKRPVRMLNLFGYTGIASLVGARAGAQVTHVDASKKAIIWAKENQEAAGLQGKPIRWICDDAVKFCAREVRREQTYDIILLDPPAYGRGPKGEVWQLFDHLPHMMDLVRQLQSQNPLMTVLTSYAIRASSFALHEISQEVFAGLDGEIHTGELILKHEGSKRTLSTSMFSRYVGKECVL